MTVICLDALTKVYRAAVPVTALDEVSLAIEPAEFVAIMGAAFGSGNRR